MTLPSRLRIRQLYPPILINFALSLDQAVRVSWFSDGIMQTDNDGDPAALFKRNVESGWIQKVASHVSMDYPYAGDIGSVFQDDNLPQTLPTKKGRGTQFANDPEQSRKFKSQYGLAFAVNLIREGVRRVVINTTVSTRNVDQVQAIYHQVSELQAFAEQIDSPTEVCWTFSPWIWRPHQARGDDPSQSPATLGLQLADMPAVNDVFSTILSDTHQRIAEGRPRVLANSAGFTQLLTDPSYRELVVNQDVPVGNRPVALQVNPDALVGLDPMFQGPEIFGPGAPQLRTLFGYLDRDPRRERNIFSKYSNPDQEWFPNIVAT